MFFAALRVWFLLFGLSVTSWALLRAYSGATETSLKSVAEGVSGGRTFKSDVLEALDPPILRAQEESLSNPVSIRSAAVIRVRQAELAWQSGASDDARAAASRALGAVRAALTVSPKDAFLWFALAWLVKNHDGYTPAVAEYLALSYASGPNEGWIAVHRNGFVVGLLAVLPPELKAASTAEFQGLVESNYIEDAASILTGPGWAQREELVRTLSRSPELVRARLAQHLVAIGFDVSIPGIDRSPLRPWK